MHAAVHCRELRSCASWKARLRLLLGCVAVGVLVLLSQNLSVDFVKGVAIDKSLRRRVLGGQGSTDGDELEFVVVPLPHVEPQMAGDTLAIIAHTIGRGSSTHDELKDVCLIDKYARDAELQEILGSNCGPVADRSRLADGAQECAVQCGKMYISLVNKGAVVEYDSSTTGTLLHHLGLPVVRLHRRDLLPVFLAATSESLYTDAANSSARFARVLELFGENIEQELNLRASMGSVPSLSLFIEDVLNEHPRHWCSRLGHTHGCAGAANLTSKPTHPPPRTSITLRPLRDLVPNPEAWCVALSHTLYLPRTHPDCVRMIEVHRITPQHLAIPTVLPTRMERQIPLLTNWTRDPFLRKCTLPGKIRETDPLGAFVMPVTSPRLQTYASRWIGLAGYGFCGNNMFWCQVEGERHPALALTETMVVCPLPDKFNDRDTIKVQLDTSGDEFAQHVTNLIYVRHRYEQLNVPVEHRRHHRLLVCTMVKNEENNIEEWMNHHIRLGVDHFALYVNLEEVPATFRIQLQEYVQSGYVTLHQWPYWFSQTQALNDCTQRYRSFSDWMAFIDVDEFYFEKYGDEQPNFDIVERIHAITTRRNHNCAYIREFVYCKRDALVRDSRPIAERFPYRMQYMIQHKPIFRPSETMGVRAYGPHYVLMIKPNKDTLNAECPILHDDEGLVLKHFRFKSLEEFVGRRQGPDSVFYHEYTAEKLTQLWSEANEKCEA